MALRTFLLGAICGGVVFLMVDHAIERRAQPSMHSTPIAQSAVEAPVPESAPISGMPSLSQAIEAPSASSRPAEAAKAAYDGALPSTPIARQQYRSPGDRATSNDRVAEVSRRDPPSSDLNAGERGDEKADIASQPQFDDPSEDPAWSHFMEQALRQFLGRHPAASQFDILAVACESSLCEIRAAGFDQSAWPVWQQVAHDTRHQPWSEFGQVGTSMQQIEGRDVFITRLARLRRN